MKKKSMRGQVAANNFAVPFDASETLAQLRPKSDNAMLEIVLLPLLVPLIGWLMGRDDILFLNAAFPWMLLAPTLTTARYGTRSGMLSLIVLTCLSVLYALIFQPSQLSTVAQVLVGSLLVVLVIGEVIQYWAKRNQQQAKALEEYKKSASQSEQALQLLHISYSQLEEDLVSRNRSLAGSLRLLDASLHQTDHTDSRVALKFAVQKMKAILDQYTWLESAAFFRVDQQKQISPKSLGSIGHIPAQAHRDPLLLEAVRRNKAISIKHEKLVQGRQLNTALKAAIPMLDSKGVLWGVLAVAEIENSAMTQQNLNLLALLCNYVANLLDNSKRPKSSAKRMVQEMHSAFSVVLNTVKTANLITLSITAGDDSADYKDYFINKVRGANRIWHIKHPDSTTLVILLPLFDEQSFKEFQESLTHNFANRFSKELSQAGVTIKYSHIRQQITHEQLQKYLIKLGKFEHASLIR